MRVQYWDAFSHLIWLAKMGKQHKTLEKVMAPRSEEEMTPDVYHISDVEEGEMLPMSIPKEEVLQRPCPNNKKARTVQ